MEKIGLSKDEQFLINNVTLKLLSELDVEKDSESVKMLAFDAWSNARNEQYQVQVIVTRYQPEFMDAFQLEVIN